MNQKVYNFLTWLAGVDRNTLSTCSTYEKIKHTGIGMLVMIPFLLGSIAMAFAIATLTDKPHIYIPIGIIWGFIVLIIDRFLISTFKKSESALKDLFSFRMLIRLIFSIGIGITVSHPLVLFVLGSTINKNLNESYQEERQTILDSFKKESDTINKDILEYRQNTIDKISDQIDCLISVRSAERSGAKIEKNCNGKTYYTSGFVGFKGRAQEYDNDINRLTKQRDSLYKEFSTFKTNKLAALSDKTKQREEALHSQKDNFSNDYLSRNIELSKLESKPIEGNPVGTTKWFLLIFFTFLDVLPVILKASLSIGEYDKKINRIEEMNIYFANYDYDNQKEIESIKKESRYVYIKSKLHRMRYADFANLSEMDEFMSNL